MGYACPFVLIATCRHDGWPYQAVSLHWCAADCGWVSLQLLSSTSSAGSDPELCISHSSASSLQDLFTLPLLIDTSVIVPQQEQLHALTMATIHSNQLEMKEPKCQEFSSGFRQTQIHGQSSGFIQIHLWKDAIHYSCSWWRFLQVSTDGELICV